SASTVVDVNSSAMIPITLGGNTDVLTNSTLAIDTAVGNTFLDLNTPAGGSSNVISGNTFVANATTNAFLAYFNGAGAAVTDKVVNNAFVASAGVSVNFDMVVQESVTGLAIQNNTFSGGAAIAIYQVASTPQNLKILGN